MGTDDCLKTRFLKRFKIFIHKLILKAARMEIDLQIFS